VFAEPGSCFSLLVAKKNITPPSQKRKRLEQSSLFAIALL
jgi:hypothetical protein